MMHYPILFSDHVNEAVRIEGAGVRKVLFIVSHCPGLKMDHDEFAEGNSHIPRTHQIFGTMIDPAEMILPLYMSSCVDACGTPNTY